MTGRSSPLHAIASMVIVLSFLLTSCSELTPIPPSPIPPTKPPISPPEVDPEMEWTSGNLMPIIEAASKLEPKKEDNSFSEEIKEDGDFKYIKEQHNVIKNRESVLFLGQNDDVLFPGAIIQGKEVDDFVYVPVIAARAPITLSLPLEGVTTTGEAIKVTVEDPSRLSNVRQGINDLLKMAIKPDTRVPAKFDYVTEQVSTSSEKNLLLGVSGSYADINVNYDFDWGSETYNNKILSLYKQVYYTVDVDLPAAPYDLFDPSAGVEGVAEALPAGSMPMYVTSVSYGWMALLFIETNYSAEEMNMALDAAYDPAGDLEAKMSIGYSAKDVFQNSKIHIIVYGGSTTGITGETLKGYSGLLELIQGSKNFSPDSPGIPIAFRLRHLADNLVAKIALTEEYTISKKVPLRQYIRISTDHLICTFDDDGSGPLDMDRIFLDAVVYQGNTQIRNVRITNYQNSSTDGFPMKAGSVWNPVANDSLYLLVDLTHFDPGAYRIVLIAQVRDYDSLGPDDWATASQTISGDQFFEKPINYFEISDPGDMIFQMFYEIQPITREECMTEKKCTEQLGEFIVTPTP